MTASAARIQLVLEKVHLESRLEQARRSSGASTSSLDGVATDLEQAVVDISQSRDRSADSRIQRAVRRALDEWDLIDDLTSAVASRSHGSKK